jgi:hypothetical protein
MDTRVRMPAQPAGPFPDPLVSLRLSARVTRGRLSDSLSGTRPAAPPSTGPSARRAPHPPAPARPWPNNVKHLQHEKTFEYNIRLKTNETFGTCTCNMCVKHMKHPNKTITTYNMKTTCCNIRIKQLKYYEHTVATYVTSRSKRLQHTSGNR